MRDDTAMRARIRTAARQLFARYGFERVSLQMIADEVGIHKSTLFHYYRFKRVLVQEVFTDVVSGIRDAVRPLAEPMPTSVEGALKQADEFVNVLVDYLMEHPEDARVLFFYLATPEDADVRIPFSELEGHPAREIYDIVCELLERSRRARLIRPLNIRQAVFNLVGAVLFYPALARDPEHRALAGADPFSDKARRARKSELQRLLRGVLDPTRGDGAAEVEVDAGEEEEKEED